MRGPLRGARPGGAPRVRRAAAVPAAPSPLPFVRGESRRAKSIIDLRLDRPQVAVGTAASGRLSVRPPRSPLSRPPGALRPAPRGRWTPRPAPPRCSRRSAERLFTHGDLVTRNFLLRNPQPLKTRAGSALREAGNLAFSLCERGGCIPLHQIMNYR